MSIVYRSEINRPLTFEELDGNFKQVETMTNAAATSAQSANAAATSAQSANAAATSAQSASAESAVQSASSASEASQTVKDFLDSIDSSLKIFPDTASGLAGTTDGQYFRVSQGVDGDTSFVYYLNDSGIATEVSTTPSSNVNLLINLLTQAMSSLLNTYDALGYEGGSIYPSMVDQYNNIILGYDSDKQRVVGIDLRSDSQSANDMNEHGQALFIGRSSIIPFYTSQEGNIILGYDSDSQSVVGLGLGSTGTTSAKSPDVKLTYSLDKGSVSVQIGYGQSLSTGVGENRIISTSQPYSNITFSSGVRGNGGDFSGTKALVEDLQRPTPDGQTDAGETICSGAANFASLLMARENGLLPSSNPIFASTAGHGSYSINDLVKGTDWYNNQLLKHISGVKSVVSGGVLHTINWLQGEADNDMATDEYVGKLVQLQKDITADAQATIGQSSQVLMLTYQHSTGAGASNKNQLALLNACEESDYIFFVTPTYIFPHHSDNLHLTPEGYKWIGAYYGRAYKQAVIDGIVPKALKPRGATFSTNEIEITFDVPQPPLVLDNSFVGAATDYGFAVYVAGTKQSISEVKVTQGNVVTIKLASALTGAPEVRYGFDYLGSGMNIRDGASGNLRDSCPETCLVNGVVRNMYYAAPHFIINAITEAF